MTERLAAIESVIAHLQHDFEQLHQVTLALQGDIAQLHLTLAKLNARMVRLDEEPEVRSAELERPPHY